MVKAKSLYKQKMKYKQKNVTNGEDLVAKTESMKRTLYKSKI